MRDVMVERAERSWVVRCGVGLIISEEGEEGVGAGEWS